MENEVNNNEPAISNVVVEEKKEDKPVYATIDDFAKIEIRVGTILTAEFIEGSDKLLRLTVDFNEETPRQILSGIKQYYSPEELIGKQCPFVTNLAPRKMKGLDSCGMILAARTGDDKIALFHPNMEVEKGAHLS